MRPQTRLDLLADRLLDDLRPLSFEEVSTPEDADTVLRMRYECVVEEGWAQPQDFPDGRERDAYDDVATSIVCREAGEIVASTRLVPPVSGRRLLVEEEFGITVEPPGQALEAGRVLIPRRHRPGRSHRIMTGLFARTWLTARALGFDRVVGQATRQMCALYRGLGLTLAELGPPRPYFGEERLPIEVAGAAQDSLLRAFPDVPVEPIPGGGRDS